MVSYPKGWSELGFLYHLRLKQRKKWLGLLGGKGKLWEGDQENMVNKKCLGRFVVQI